MPSVTPQNTPAAPRFQAPKKKKKWVKPLIIVGAVLAAALVLFLLRGRKSQTVSGSYLPATATRRHMAITVTGTGTIKPRDDYRATTLLRGEILSAPFEEGDMVKKDQVLFVLDSTDAENNIKSARSAVSRAELGVEQAQAALDQAALAQEQAQLSRSQAQLSLDSLKKTQQDNVDDMRFKATADGVVAKLYVDPGDTVAAGTPIADILDRENMELTAPFHSVAAAAFSIGQSASVTVSGTAETLSGTIKSISPTDTVAAGGAVVRQVTIRVQNPGTLSNTSTATAQVGSAASAAQGAFQYAASKQVMALMSGKIDALYVKEGDRVTNGQALGTFELPDLQQQLDNAQIALDNAQVSIENSKITYRNADIALRNAQLALTDAQDALARAEDLLDDYTITSPIDGTVIEKNYKAGDNVEATSTGFLAVIYDLSQLQFDVSVSELDVSRLQVGQSVTFTSDALPGQTFTGHVDKININGTTISGSTNYPVTVVVDSGEGLYPGMNVSATILVQEVGDVLTIPVDAVQRPDLVYIPTPGALNDKGELVDPDKLTQIQVSLGETDSEYIQVLQGLSEGDVVFVPNASSSIMGTMMGMMGG